MENNPQRLTKRAYLAVVILAYEICQFVFSIFLVICVYGWFWAPDRFSQPLELSLKIIMAAAPLLILLVYYLKNKMRGIEWYIISIAWVLMFFVVSSTSYVMVCIPFDPFISTSDYAVNPFIIFSLNYYLFLGTLLFVALRGKKGRRKILVFLIPAVLILARYFILNYDVPHFQG